MKRSHAVILAVVILLGGGWFVYNTYVGSTGDGDLSGQDETVRDVPANNPGQREQPGALPNNSR
ncbi:hypothetical protein GCM10007276_10300 [Agaricicola taiwanensis]|uniref:Uncharacterized protein n=1 Tax=Agaricicola taiwanensis TaxID=591372 RepID=A0A8J2YFU2_9RHOB|nr:hypothetical protein [Agaricicola taiwanensis]GGE34763.1 hypothetical protein GCM10007276_10300 [Agaricicola taiwanensis]